MRTILLSLLAIISFTNLAAQSYYPEVNHPEWFKLIPKIDEDAPDWVHTMYTEDDNFTEILEQYENYYQNNDFVKNAHTQNFKFWLKQVRNHVNEQGRVTKKSESELFRYYNKQRLKREGNELRTMDDWSVVGPNTTYNSNGSLTTRPTQANVYCIEVAPSNTSVLYAGMETGGVFKTVDKGLNWYPVSYDYGIGSPRDIKVDPTDEDIVYVSSGTAIYKSMDGGDTWILKFSASGSVEQFYINKINPDTIFAATQDSLLRSLDGGDTWSGIFGGYIYDIEAKVGSEDTLFIATKNDVAKRPEIFRSDDAGETWTLKDFKWYSPSDLSEAKVYGCKIGVTEADPNRIYAGVIANGKVGDNGWIGVYTSTNLGDGWIDHSGIAGGPYAPGMDPDSNWYIAGYSSGYHQGWYNFDLDVSNVDPLKFWVGTIWFSESDNAGANFDMIRSSRSLEMHADIQDIEVVGNEIWIASDGGINYSNDECQTVEVRMTGITASDMWGFAQGWNDDVWAGGRYHNGDVYYHANYGAGNSAFLGGAESATGYINQMDNGKAHFSDIGDKRVSSSLSVASSSIPNLGKYPTQSYFDFNYSEVEWGHEYANEVFVGQDQSIYKSRDGGANFENLFSFPGNIRRFEVSRDDPNYIYAIVVSGNNHSVFKSIDAGLSFVELADPPYIGGSWNNLSIALNPFDKNEIWQASNSSSDGNKIFSSIDGGVTWINRYSAEISGEKIKDLVFQKSDDGDVVYAMTNDNFFYYDLDATTWSQYNSGLPIAHSAIKMLPLYRDEKLRIAGAKGVWESDMVRTSKVQVKPYTLSDSIFCKRDTVQFECHSILNHSGASWNWSFDPAPLWISDSTLRNPKAVFGAEGGYSAILTVTQNATQYSDTLENIVYVEDQCTAEEVPGQTLTVLENHDYMVARDVNLTNLTHFTMTGWWKPDSLTRAFSALFSSGDWCAHCDYTEALMVNYFNGKVWYKWPGNAANWGSSSGINIPLDEWSYVALVITPDSAIMYLNEEKYTHVIPLQPGNIQDLYIGHGHYNKSFRGDIDEVTFWRRSLSQDEIRLLRHITKEDEVESDPDLIAYYQFNELVAGSIITDNAGVLHGVLNNGATLSPSSVPVGGGSSHKETVSSGGSVSFTGTGAILSFPASGTYPNGEIVVTRIDQAPNVLSDSISQTQSYWVINNYGINETFSLLDSIILQHLEDSLATPYKNLSYLARRSQNEHIDNWSVADSTVDLSDEEGIHFNDQLEIETASQLTLGQHELKGVNWIGVVSSDWNDPANWGENVVPDRYSSVLIPDGAPFYPIVDENILIYTLEVEVDALITVLANYTFTVLTR